MEFVIQNLSIFPMDLRKDILLLTRVRVPPEHNQRLVENFATWNRDHIGYISDRHLKGPATTRLSTPRAILKQVGEIVYSTSLTSLLSSFLRTIIFDSPSWKDLEEQEFLQSAFKEFQATQQEDSEPLLNYNAILNPLCHNQRFDPLLEPNPRLAKYIYSQLVKWRSKLGERLLLPRYSRKNMSRETASSIGKDRCTGMDVEEFYHRTGRIAQGSIEMRQAWKGNDLSPRTYFAQGGDAYFSSRYCQEIFNSLVDSLSSTHRTGRFNLSKFKLTPQHITILYDFSSFTSSMFEQKWFLRALSNFCMGYRVHLFDTHFGPVETDLGLLLMDYIQNATNCSRFYLRGDLVEKTGLHGYFIHRVAGFLGVYGNLASCTFLHGVIALYITGLEDMTSVVGDDALIAKILIWARDQEEGQVDDDAKTVEGVIAVLQSVGKIARKKFAILESPSSDYDDEILDENTWAYLKRSLVRFSNEVHLSIQFDIANLALVFQYSDTLRDYGHSQPTKAIASQITALLIKLFRHPPSDKTLEDLAIILRGIYRAVGFPTSGLVPKERFMRRHTKAGSWRSGRESQNVIRGQEEAFYILPVLPQTAEDFKNDPLKVLADTKTEMVYSVPVVMLVEDIPVVDFSRVFVGDEVEGKNRFAKYLVDFGYIEKEVVMIERDYPFDGDELFQVFSRLRDPMYGLLSRFTIVSRIPHVFL